jgi:hypothetical protein
MRLTAPLRQNRMIVPTLQGQYRNAAIQALQGLASRSQSWLTQVWVHVPRDLSDLDNEPDVDPSE